MVGIWAGCRNSLCGSTDAGLRGSGVASEGFPAGLLSGIKSPCRKCTDTEPPSKILGACCSSHTVLCQVSFEVQSGCRFAVSVTCKAYPNHILPPDGRACAQRGSGQVPCSAWTAGARASPPVMHTPPPSQPRSHF